MLLTLLLACQQAALPTSPQGSADHYDPADPPPSAPGGLDCEPGSPVQALFLTRPVGLGGHHLIWLAGDRRWVGSSIEHIAVREGAIQLGSHTLRAGEVLRPSDPMWLGSQPITALESPTELHVVGRCPEVRPEESVFQVSGTQIYRATWLDHAYYAYLEPTAAGGQRLLLRPEGDAGYLVLSVDRDRIALRRPGVEIEGWLQGNQLSLVGRIGASPVQELLSLEPLGIIP